MPKYDFQCPHCEKVFEAFRSFSQGTDGVVCPDDGEIATRLFSPPMEMIVFGGKNTAPAVVPPGGVPRGGPRGFGGHGHSHGPGTAPHSH